MRSVCIVGGGLAGLTLGIGLRRRSVPVTVIEAGSYPRHRVCGEFVSGIWEEALHELGIADLLQQAERPQDTAWYEEGRAFFRGHLPERAYGLSRYHLDQTLAARFLELGGELVVGRRVLEKDWGEGTVQACGRFVQGANSPGGGWLGLKAHFAGLETLADLEIHFGNGAYVGLTRVEGGWANVTGLFRRGVVAGERKGGNPLCRALREAGIEGVSQRLERAQLREGSLKGVNRFLLGWQPGFGRGIRIGDAAAMIPPLTGNGMTMALQGALAALRPLEAWSRGHLSWDETERVVVIAQRKMFERKMAWAAALQSVLMNPLLRRVCAAALRHGWVSFETLYRRVR